MTGTSPLSFRGETPLGFRSIFWNPIESRQKSTLRPRPTLWTRPPPRRALPSLPPGPGTYRIPSTWWKSGSETPSTLQDRRSELPSTRTSALVGSPAARSRTQPAGSAAPHDPSRSDRIDRGGIYQTRQDSTRKQEPERGPLRLSPDREVSEKSLDASHLIPGQYAFDPGGLFFQ